MMPIMYRGRFFRSTRWLGLRAWHGFGVGWGFSLPLYFRILSYSQDIGWHLR